MVAEDHLRRAVRTGRAVRPTAGNGTLSPLRGLAEKTRGEVGSDIGDLHRRVLFGVAHEEVAPVERLRELDRDSAGGGEKRRVNYLFA